MALSLFQFHGDTLNIYGTYEKPYFMVKEVCDIIKVKNRRDLYNRIPEKYKTTLGEVFAQRVVGKTPPLEIGKNLQPHTVLLTEAGLYFAVCTSNQTKRCEEFRDWVFETVLVKLRTEGQYSLQQLSSTHSEAIQYNSNKVDLTQLCENKSDLSNCTTVGKCVDEIYPKQYKRGFKQYIGRLVHKQIESSLQVIVDTFQQSHKPKEVKAYTYSDTFKNTIIQIINDELERRPDWLLPASP
jgi:prophage antirepressor-like protein